MVTSYQSRPLKIMVANRGEIAMRVFRAIRELGHIPVAVYSKADRTSLHVGLAEHAMCIGDGPSLQSYLNSDRVLDAARKMKVDCIHPGYGFLSEKADFAKRVAEEGFLLVGPRAEHMASMGDKVMARKTMAQAGLPIVAGTEGGVTEEQEALHFAHQIGYPLMIKALAGGGGRGMRLVEKSEDFLSLFRRAQSEAQQGFNDNRLYLERFVRSPHHIEVQIIADAHGRVCHLLDRECSVQRRHQKILEEAQSPYLSPSAREKLLAAAVDAIKKLGYVNAGTIEFLVDDSQNFYFMEMNTRLQVEHPITEWITGIDIVKEQIRVALGEPLSFSQDDVKPRGHALEMRICAEDPERFLPQSGLVKNVRFPSGMGVRVDSHLYSGYEIPMFYDSMIAKLSVWGRDRTEAIARALAALEETRIGGIKTNIPVHQQLLRNETFLSGNYTTQLVGGAFHFSPRALRDKDWQGALVAAALLAYQRESVFDNSKDERSCWRDAGRREATQ